MCGASLPDLPSDEQHRHIYLHLHITRSLGIRSMRRTTRLSGQLPSPPKSSDGSALSESSSDINNNITTDNAMTPPSDKKSRVLRRQSTQNVSDEIRAFFAVSSLPTGRYKRESLLSAVDRVSALWNNPRGDQLRVSKTSRDDSSLQSQTSGLYNEDDRPLKKRWLTSGLYAGSRTTADNSKILAKPRKSDPGPGAGRPFEFTLPIFHGKPLMEQQRDFKLPWNLYATTGEKCKPPNWSRVKRSTSNSTLLMRYPCGRRSLRQESPSSGMFMSC
jgi:hypothetical protein